ARSQVAAVLTPFATDGAVLCECHAREERSGDSDAAGEQALHRESVLSVGRREFSSSEATEASGRFGANARFDCFHPYIDIQLGKIRYVRSSRIAEFFTSLAFA